MAVETHVYANDGAGGPVNTTTPIAIVSGMTFSPPALGTPSDNTFLIRNFDTVSGLEEDNVDARIRIVIDAGGNDITNRPNAPDGLTAILGAAVSVKLSWTYNAGGQGAAPTGFHVYVGTPTVSYASSVQTVVYAKGRLSFSCTLTGLTPGSTYQIGVRSFNASIEETNVIVTTVVPDATGPDPVDGLTGVAIV
ncbi:MAG: fibronectin type III domain-containing protein [Patescibacteria group bacterium]|nr:fibronectin type III domain-containing protein [Patescibacteria group bacterium]